MFTILVASVLLHPVHETTAEIEWNDNSKRLEVALRLDVLDEQWLRKRSGRVGDVSQWAIGYLKQRFRVAEPPKRGRPDPTTYHWIGRDEEGSHVWWYFEIEPAQRSRPQWIDQRVLFEREEDYTHRILILDRVPRSSLTLSIGRPRADLDQATHDPNAFNSRRSPQSGR